MTKAILHVELRAGLGELAKSRQAFHAQIQKGIQRRVDAYVVAMTDNLWETLDQGAVMAFTDTTSNSQ